MDNNFTNNMCLSTPGLAINAAGSATVKYGTTFTFKSGGRISPSVTNATAPSLATATLHAPLPNGTAVVAGVLATGYSRYYTLIGTLPINGTATITPTFSWLASPDFVGTTDVLNIGLFPSSVKNNDANIGYVAVLNQSGSNFTPNTTALDATNVTTTYINNYGVVGN